MYYFCFCFSISDLRVRTTDCGSYCCCLSNAKNYFALLKVKRFNYKNELLLSALIHFNLFHLPTLPQNRAGRGTAMKYMTDYQPKKHFMFYYLHNQLSKLSYESVYVIERERYIEKKTTTKKHLRTVVGTYKQKDSFDIHWMT